MRFAPRFIVIAGCFFGLTSLASAQDYAEPDAISDPAPEDAAPAIGFGAGLAAPRSNWGGEQRRERRRQRHAVRGDDGAGYGVRRHHGYGHAAARHHGYGRAVMLAPSAAPYRVYAAPELPMVAPATTLPTRVIYAEPTPRVAYYNTPVIVDGLRTHRAAATARYHRYDECGEGCLRSAY